VYNHAEILHELFEAYVLPQRAYCRIQPWPITSRLQSSAAPETLHKIHPKQFQMRSYVRLDVPKSSEYMLKH
jgi:hypothetical protein